MEVVKSPIIQHVNPNNVKHGDWVAFPDTDIMGEIIWRVTNVWNGGITLTAVSAAGTLVEHQCSWLSIENSGIFFVARVRRS